MRREQECVVEYVRVVRGSDRSIVDDVYARILALACRVGNCCCRGLRFFDRSNRKVSRETVDEWEIRPGVGGHDGCRRAHRDGGRTGALQVGLLGGRCRWIGEMRFQDEDVGILGGWKEGSWWIVCIVQLNGRMKQRGMQLNPRGCWREQNVIRRRNRGAHSKQRSLSFTPKEKINPFLEKRDGHKMNLGRHVIGYQMTHVLSARRLFFVLELSRAQPWSGYKRRRLTSI